MDGTSRSPSRLLRCSRSSSRRVFGRKGEEEVRGVTLDLTSLGDWDVTPVFSRTADSPGTTPKSPEGLLTPREDTGEERDTDLVGKTGGNWSTREDRSTESSSRGGRPSRDLDDSIRGRCPERGGVFSVGEVASTVTDPGGGDTRGPLVSDPDHLGTPSPFQKVYSRTS